MYLVELRPGKEELYRSSDELALAIRNGDVDSRSRIYHRATAKWISITLHPQYKAIVSAPKEKEEPAPRLARKGWTFLGGIAPTPEPAPAPAVSNGDLLRWRSPMALGISGVLLMLGIQLALSGPRSPGSGRTRAVATRAPDPTLTPVREPALRQETITLASTITWPERTPVLPRAPRLRSKSLRSALVTATSNEVDGKTIEALLSRYADAHASARKRLEGGIRVARLTRLFAASRLTPNGGVTDTRMSLAGAANFIRVYRQQQVAIEAAYQDSVVVLARQFNWTPTQAKQWNSREISTEDPVLEALSGSLLAGIDSVLGVLAAQAGAYKIRGTAIAFEDPIAAQRYGALRRHVKEQINAAVAAGGATTPGPTGLLLRAIGTTTLPRET
jgi:hypothetical protein